MGQSVEIYLFGTFSNKVKKGFPRGNDFLKAKNSERSKKAAKEAEEQKAAEKRPWEIGPRLRPVADRGMGEGGGVGALVCDPPLSPLPASRLDLLCATLSSLPCLIT